MNDITDDRISEIVSEEFKEDLTYWIIEVKVCDEWEAIHVRRGRIDVFDTITLFQTKEDAEKFIMDELNYGSLRHIEDSVRIRRAFVGVEN